MKVEFENLGPIKRGQIEFEKLKSLNVIIGPNNCGKTYFSYFIYTVLRNILIERELNIDNLSKKMRSIGKCEENNFSNELLNTDLPFVFHTSENNLKKTKINISFSEDEKFNENEKYFLEKTIDINNIYFFPAERSGTTLFYNQLLENRNDILREIELSKDTEIRKIINKISRYSEPINQYIKFLNRLEEFQNRDETEIYKNVLQDIKNVIDGEILIKDNQIIYKSKDDVELNMGLVSSSVKTLTGFYLYIKYFAEKGDIIFIDELELNLHPKNQQNLIKIFNNLTKYGIKFILSTHSPLITQEINNMILFEEKNKNKNIKEVMSEYELDVNYGINKEDVSIWFLNDGIVNELEITEEGFDTLTFNETVAEMNNFYRDLYFLDED